MDRAPRTVAKGLRGNVERYIGDQRGDGAHLNLKLRSRSLACADRRPGSLKDLEGESPHRFQPQVAFPDRPLKHFALGERGLFAIASPLGFREINDGIERAASDS